MPKINIKNEKLPEEISFRPARGLPYAANTVAYGWLISPSSSI